MVAPAGPSFFRMRPPNTVLWFVSVSTYFTSMHCTSSVPNGRSNRAEVDWGMGIDGEGRSSAGSLMVATAGRPDFGRERVNRAQGWVEEGEGEVREVGVCGNEGAARGGRHERRRRLCSSSVQREREEERGGRKRTRLRGDKNGRASAVGKVRRRPTRGGRRRCCRSTAWARVRRHWRVQ